MRNSFKQRKKRVGSVLSAVVSVCYVLPLAVGSVVAAKEFVETGEAFAALLFLMLYGVLGGAVVVGVLLALRQRLREIDGGEEDDAAQY